MTGLSSSDGRGLDPLGDDYLRRSIADNLTTPIGGRVMLRDYGSWIPELVDRPLNDLTRLQIYAATALALLRWQRRARLKRVRLIRDAARVTLSLELIRTDRPRPAPLSVRIPLAMAGGGS